jgi:CTP:molybdopterin cytidylyltransferase MocA
MASAPVGAVVLAAGLSRRFGSAKMLAPWRGRPLISWVLDEVAGARDLGFLTTGVVVHRPDDVDTPRLARERGLEPHLNTRPSTGMASSLQLGLNALTAERWQPLVAALVVMGDQPLLRRDVIGTLVGAFRPTLELVRPAYSADAAEPGHPVLVHRRLWDRARSLSGDEGFGALATAGSFGVEIVPVDGMNPDIDTPGDLSNLEDTAGQP